MLTLLWSAVLLATAVGCRYDASPLTYDPSGRVLQLENARAAAKRGQAVVGFAAKDGLLLITPQTSPSPTTVVLGRSKFVQLDPHVFLTSCGFAADSLALANVGKVVCANYKREFGCNVPVENLAEQLADWMHAQTRRGSSRPLGVGALVAGVDDELNFQIYSLEPQGACQGWKAVCIGGSHSERSNGVLEDSAIDFASLASVWTRLAANRGELLQKLFSDKAELCDDGTKPARLRIQIQICSRTKDGLCSLRSRTIELGDNADLPTDI